MRAQAAPVAAATPSEYEGFFFSTGTLVPGGAVIGGGGKLGERVGGGTVGSRARQVVMGGVIRDGGQLGEQMGV